MNPKNLSAARQVGAQIPRNAEAVVPRTRRPKPLPSAVHGESLHRRLSALGGSGGSVWQALNEYVMDGNIVKKYDLQCSIKELRKFKDYHRALQVMEWMEMRKINYSYTDHAIRLDLVHKTKGLAAAENYLSNLSTLAKNIFTYGALLNCYCTETMEDKALELFEKFDQLGFLLNPLPFTNLMSMYMKMGKPEKVLPLVEKMKHKNIYPSTYTYNILMQSYALLNDIGGVERVLEEIEKAEEEKCDWTTYSNLVAIYVKAGLFEKAKLALGKLEEKLKRRAPRQAYNFVISFYAAIGEHGEVNRVWKTLNSVYPTFNNLSYLVMLQSLAKLNDIEGLTQCFKEWESSCSSYDTRLVDVVIGAYLHRDMFTEAKLVFEDANKRSKGPFLKSKEKLMFFCVKNSQVEMALSYLDAAVSEAKDHEWSPSWALVSAFLNCFEVEKDVHAAEKVLNILKPFHCLNSNVYKLLLKIYVAAGKFAPEMRRRLEEDGIEINCEIEELLQRVCPQLD